MAIKTFGVEDKGKENCRLRAYNVVNGTLQGTYTGGENKVFEQLKIYPLKTLALEIKDPGTEFVDYDPN
jgi:hypothetical protein